MEVWPVIFCLAVVQAAIVLAEPGAPLSRFPCTTSYNDLEELMADIELSRKRCVPCEGGVPQLTDMEIEDLMPRVPGWQMKVVTMEGMPLRTIQKRFEFKDFRAAMAFLRQVEEIAESEGHHPDFCVHYNKVDFTIWTHAIRGLHENDFILAAKIDALKK